MSATHRRRAGASPVVATTEEADQWVGFSHVVKYVIYDVVRAIARSCAAHWDDKTPRWLHATFAGRMPRTGKVCGGADWVVWGAFRHRLPLPGRTGHYPLSVMRANQRGFA